MYQRMNGPYYEPYRPHPYDESQVPYSGYYQPYEPHHPYEPQHPYEQQMMYNMPYPNDSGHLPPPPPATPFEHYAKPAQPQNWPMFMQQNPNFYPEQQGEQSQQPQSGSNLMGYFQDQNGQVDFGKVLSTVNQVATTWQQVTPVVQQINSVIKSFR